MLGPEVARSRMHVVFGSTPIEEIGALVTPL
jgi:hypothetical protein